jgi:hypothetical protein
MPRITFITKESNKTIMKLMGIDSSGQTFEQCPLNVGDLFSYPEAPSIAYRVLSRWYQVGDDEDGGMWNLAIEPAGDPLQCADSLIQP